MTRKDRLYAMRMQELVIEAEKLGIKVNKKGSKAKAVEKILEAEAALVTESQETEDEVVRIELTGDEEMVDCTQQETEQVVESEEHEAEEQAIESEETEKPKKERKPRKPMDRSAQYAFEEVMEQTCADHDVVVKRWEKIPNLVSLRFADTNKTFADLRFTRKGVRLNVHTTAADALMLADVGVGYKIQNNYYLPAALDIVPYEVAEGSDPLFDAVDLLRELLTLDRSILKPQRANAKAKAAEEQAAAEVAEEQAAE